MIKYKEFKIGGEEGLFEIKTGRDIIIGTTEEGEIPLISHQHDNNGIAKYIRPLKNRRIFNHKETIALADRGVFLATNQDKDFYIGTRVKALIFKDGEKSRNIRLFFVTAINKLQTFFEEYLNNATDKLPNLKIMLPVDENDEIDYKFMNDYINDIEEMFINETKEENEREIHTYLKVSGIENSKLSEDEINCLKDYRNNKIKYREFELSYLFDSSNGDYDIQQKHINNKGVYVVSSGEQNCGIRGKTDVEAKIFDRHTITIDMFGCAFFRDFEYKMVTHARVFSLKYKEKELSVEEGIYLTSQFSYMKKIFSYSNMASWEKIKSRTIMLPVNDDNTINYSFMNLFLKAQEKILIEELIQKDNQIVNITKKVVENSNKI